MIAQQKVLVVGGSSGIGAATARLLAEQGAVVVVGGRSQASLDVLVRQDPRLTAVVVDAADRASLDAAMQAHGPLDHLVVCVSGAGGAGTFPELDLADLRAGFAAKTFAQLETVQAALPHLAERASVTLVTAASAHSALPGTVGLAAINGALEAAVPPLATELAPRRVNAVSPGVVDTPWWDRVHPDMRAAVFDQTAARLPVGRVGAPEDLAAAVLALLDNPFVTGHVMVVDGGGHLAR